MVRNTSGTKPCLALPGAAVPALHSMGKALPSPRALPLRGGGPQNYANPPISVGGCSVRLEKRAQHSF